MNKQPLVSVVIPTYNRDKYVKRVISNVFSQTYKNIEAIIVDDSSNHKIKKILLTIQTKNNRVIYIKNKIKLGFTQSLNKGINAAKGKYIARIDDDDYWCDKDKLKKQVEFLENNLDYVLTSGGMIAVNKKGYKCSKRLPPQTDKEIRNFMLFDCLIPHSSVVFKKDVWKILGGYDQRLDPAEAEDWDLWMRMGTIGKIYSFQEYFVYCLWDKDGKTNKYKSLKFNLKLRKKYRNEYPNFWKAYSLGWAYYFYYFIPFKQLVRPINRSLKNIFFRYKVYEKLKDKKFESIKNLFFRKNIYK